MKLIRFSVQLRPAGGTILRWEGKDDAGNYISYFEEASSPREALKAVPTMTNRVQAFAADVSEEEPV